MNREQGAKPGGGGETGNPYFLWQMIKWGQISKNPKKIPRASNKMKKKCQDHKLTPPPPPPKKNHPEFLSLKNFEKAIHKQEKQ